MEGQIIINEAEGIDLIQRFMADKYNVLIKVNPPRTGVALQLFHYAAHAAWDYFNAKK